MVFASWYVYVCWVPLLLWGALFFWFWRFSGPLFLRKKVREGKKWAVVPEFISKNRSKVSSLRARNVVFSLVVSCFTAYSVCWALSELNFANPVYGFIAILPLLILSCILYRVAVGKLASTYQAAYFLEYRRARFETERKGTFQNEADVHNRTIWSFTKKLRNAEAHGRLWKYVHAMASTKKIPPDVYAETMYGNN